MQYLKVTDLTKSFNEKVLVYQASFDVQKGQKIALVAKNGSGKSTLIKLLMGDLDYPQGTIEWKQGARIGYLPQEMKMDMNSTVRKFIFEGVEKDDLEQEVQLTIAMNKLNVAGLLDQLCSTLSGGEAKRVALAKVLAQEVDVLILDEPTNHLDLEMIEWLEWYLKKQAVTLFMVTHDRYFLQRVCTDIYELDRGKVIKWPGNYSYYLEQKSIREQNEHIELHKMKQLMKKELARVRKAPQGRGTKSVYREGQFFEQDEQYQYLKGVNEAEQAKREIPIEERRLGSKIFTFHKVSKAFGAKTILKDFSHEFKHNERIGFIGKNGVGKSTFIRMLMGEESVDAGRIQVGETVVFGHYEQRDVEFLPTQRVIDVVDDKALLTKFLFPSHQHHTFANNLSGGEKRRLYLLTILMKKPNFLILDEPTNDLDLMSLGVLEEFLLHYQGCLIVVSHDRFFMDKIIDQLFVFEGQGQIRQYQGTYSQYSQQVKNGELKIKNHSTDEKGDSGRDSSGAVLMDKKQHIDEKDNQTGKKKLSYMEQREVDQIVRDLEKLEKRKDEINEIFQDTLTPYDEIKALSKEMAVIVNHIQIKEARRFELMQFTQN